MQNKEISANSPENICDRNILQREMVLAFESLDFALKF